MINSLTKWLNLCILWMKIHPPSVHIDFNPRTKKSFVKIFTTRELNCALKMRFFQISFPYSTRTRYLILFMPVWKKFYALRVIVIIRFEFEIDVFNFKEHLRDFPLIKSEHERSKGDTVKRKFLFLWKITYVICSFQLIWFICGLLKTCVQHVKHVNRKVWSEAV